MAIIRIPKIDVDYVVVEGTDTESLKKGPGHYTDTAYPWQDTGRVGIAGHRTTYLAPFWSLNELRPGDRIVLATEYGIFDYRVSAHGRHAADGDPALGRFGPASDGGPEPRPDDLQPALLGVDPARGDRRPGRLSRSGPRRDAQQATAPGQRFLIHRTQTWTSVHCTRVRSSARSPLHGHSSRIVSNRRPCAVCSNR